MKKDLEKKIGIVNTGQYADKLKTYVKIVGGHGRAKATSVGMTKDGQYIKHFK